MSTAIIPDQERAANKIGNGRRYGNRSKYKAIGLIEEFGRSERI
jgi:hypothetical protein